VKHLYVFCEGATEQGFCNQVLSLHLLPLNIGVHTIPVAHSRHHQRIHRGGVPTHFSVLHDDIGDLLKLHQRRPDVYFTTMIDLYGLPGDFPGRAAHTRIPGNPTPYVEALEREFEATINNRRFIPYIQIHEYEALLFADPDAFRIAFENIDQAIARLKAIADSYPSVEHINDGRSTAPSKRIFEEVPKYETNKATAGPDIAEFIGLPRLREACPHFDAWVTRLERL
jgi:hypothetical protein